MKDLKLRILLWIESIGFERKQLVKGKILDKEFTVRKGTIKEKEDNDMAWLFALSAHATNVYDVGANIGQAAILMFYHDCIQKMVIVDPNPRALSIAAENIIGNNLSHKCHFVSAFVSDTLGEEIDFYTVSAGASGSKYHTFAKTAKRLNSHYKVPTTTIDAIIKSTGVVPDLIKVDVEGAESDVLGGATRLAKFKNCKLMIEMHSGEELSILENTKLILEWCTNNDYRAWYLKTKEPLTLDLIKTRGRYHTLLLPAQMEFPSYLKDIKERGKLPSY